jgi:hypothetical protein
MKQRQLAVLLGLTVARVAHLQGISIRTMRRHIATGRVRATRIGRKLYITPQDAYLWLGRELSVWHEDDQPTPEYDWWPVRTYAAIAGLSQRQVRYQIEEGALRTVKVGGRRFIYYHSDGRQVGLDAILGDTRNRKNPK